MSTTVATEIPDRHLVDRSGAFLDRLWRQAFRCLDVPRQLHRRRRHLVTDDGADPLDRGHGAPREPRHRGARSSRGTCTARTSSTPPIIPRSRSRARRSSRSRRTSCASPAISRSAASRARSSSTPRSRAPATTRTATRGSASPPPARSTAPTGASPGTRRRSPTARSPSASASRSPSTSRPSGRPEAP